MKKAAMFVVLMMLCVSSTSLAMYTVDGDISDWGVDLDNFSSFWRGYLDTNTPNEGVDYVTDDDADYYNAAPGPSAGTSTWGWTANYGNSYDAEAMYFDSDDTYAYFAVVTGTARNEQTLPAGDLFISTNSNPFSDLSYGYAIDVFNGNVYTVGTMEGVSVAANGIANPWQLARNPDGSVTFDNLLIGQTELVYSNPLFTHSVIEGRIPLELINMGSDIWLHWTMKCGNDYLNLQGSRTNPVPEPATMVLFGSGLLGMAFRRKFS